MNRPLGDSQKAVLKALKTHGYWRYGCNWVWASPSLTRKILDSLVKRKLVEVRSEDVGGPNEIRTWRLAKGHR